MRDYLITVHFRKHIKFAGSKSSTALYWVRHNSGEAAKSIALAEGKKEYNNTAFLASVTLDRQVNENAKYPILNINN